MGARVGDSTPIPYFSSLGGILLPHDKSRSARFYVPPQADLPRPQLPGNQLQVFAIVASNVLASWPIRWAREKLRRVEDDLSGCGRNVWYGIDQTRPLNNVARISHELHTRLRCARPVGPHNFPKAICLVTRLSIFRSLSTMRLTLESKMVSTER